jgi:hypothetical protein
MTHILDIAVSYLVGALLFFVALLIGLLAIMDPAAFPAQVEAVAPITTPTWTKIESPPSYTGLYRTKTPRGWLVYSSSYDRLTYVPDSEHEWDISEVD